MGLLSSIFGGGGSSSSSSTSNTSQTGDGGAEAAIGSSGDQIALSNIGSGVELQVNERPIDSGEIEGLIAAISGAAVDSSTATAQALLEAGRPVADVARSASGTQSEAGRLINQLAIPAAVLGGIYFILRRNR